MQHETEIKEKLATNPKAKTTNKGRPPAGEWFEEEIYEWILAKRKYDISLTSRTIVEKIISIDPLFETIG